MDKEPLPLSNQKRSFDVCVVCAMAEEAKAFMEVAKTLGASDFQQAFSSANLLYHYTTINNRKEELLNLQVSWQTSYGPLEAGLHMQRILDEFKPGFIGMTGICAGDKRKVVLGDIIVAERAFLSDTGKFLMDTTGSRYQEYDTETHPLHSKLLHFIRGFEGWKPNVANLARPMSLHQQCDWLLKTLLEETTSSIDKIGLQILNQYAPDWRKIDKM